MTTEFPEDFDPSKEEGSTFDLVPVGEYPAEMIEARVGQPKSGDGYNITALWRIMSDKYEGRQIYQTITFSHSNEQAQKIGRRTVKDLCTAMGIEGAVRDASVFLFKPVKIKVGIEKDKKGVYDDKNKVMRITPLNPTGNGTSATSAAPKPVTAPSLPAMAASTAALKPTGSAPWNRG
jgi:hypothetical protein